MLITIYVSLLLFNCGGQTIHSPSATLKETGRPSSVHIEAMAMLDVNVGKYLEVKGDCSINDIFYNITNIIEEKMALAQIDNNILNIL